MLVTEKEALKTHCQEWLGNSQYRYTGFDNFCTGKKCMAFRQINFPRGKPPGSELLYYCGKAGRPDIPWEE